MIIQIVKIAFKGKQFRNNPANFMQDEANGFLNGLVFLPFFVSGLFVILFFILGFTTLLTGPYGFFKFIFFITFIPFILFLYIVLKTLKIIKRMNKNILNETIKVKAEVKQ